MVDIEGAELSADDRELLAHPLVGGLILFTRNFVSVAQLEALIEDIRNARPGILIAVDHEGGRVQRFRQGFTRIPAMAAFGCLEKTSSAQGLALAYECGWLLASELLSVGIDFSFTPVLDIDYGYSAVIGDRSFGQEPERIAMLAEQLMRGMHEAGMPATGKHFPGHGFVTADSHLDIPRDERGLAALEDGDLKPFCHMINLGLDAIMPAHVIYEAVDTKPAGFSSVWLQDILRQRLKFDGVIFSDDLTMEGASVAGGYADRAKAAIAAGCDMLLVCNNRLGAKEVLAYIEAHYVLEDFTKQVHRLRKLSANKSALTLEQLQQSPRWQSVSHQLAAIIAG